MMKKLAFFFLLAAFACMGTTKAQTVYIGSGTDSLVVCPTNTVQNYSLIEQLYLASELNIPAGAVITSISFYHVRTTNASSSAYLNRNVEVYLKNTTKSSFSSSSNYLIPSSYEKVYGSTLYASSNGWITLTLSTPFIYTGDNLMVAFDDNTGHSSASGLCFLGHTTGENRRLAFYSSSYNPRIDSLNSYQGYKSTDKRRANIRISYTTSNRSNPVSVGYGMDSSIVCPVNTVYKYSLVEQLYLASELNIPAGSTITSLSFYHVRSSDATSNLNRNVVVYLVNTSRSSFSSETDYTTPTSSNEVYSGNLSATASGWVTLQLSKSFTYTGGNLAVIIDDNTGSSTGQELKFRTHNTASNMRHAFYHDTYNPAIGSLSSYSGFKTIGKNRANIRIGYLPSATAIQSTTAAKLPYSCSFSSTSENNQWILKNMSDDNLPAWGIANGRMFVNGHNPSYKRAAVLAERLINTGNTDSLNVKFYCRVNGESKPTYAYDYIAVFLVPADTDWQPYTGGSNPHYIANADVYDLPYALHFGDSATLANTKLADVNGTISTTFVNPDKGKNYRLVFVWRNDAGGGTGEGAYISSLYVTGIHSQEYTPKSTAQWYGYATYSPNYQPWVGKFISFTMQNPEQVAVASEEVDKTYAAAYAEDHVWYITTTSNNSSLVRSQLDQTAHALSGRISISMASGVLESNVKSMAYHPVEKKMYFVAGDQKLYRLDLSDPEHYTVMGTMTDTLQTFAINAQGEAYGITLHTGNLMKVNLSNGSTTLVGPTGEACMYVQSMAFDPQTGELFWAQYSSSNRPNGLFYVDVNTGKAHYIGAIGGGKGASKGTELTGLFTAYAADAVAEVSSESLQLYPNPVTNVLNVKGISENCNIQIYDATGRKIMQIPAVQGENVQVNTSALSAGLYFVKAGRNTGKFVISR
ncbi:MAG: T9SS type A sorting domain-containing protein [Bacteroidales bacterium]|nr:T9SS type A sorting domain-containing protein [Bacteroidales bacterium]